MSDKTTPTVPYQNERTLHLGRELFSFDSEKDWERYARRSYAFCGVQTHDTVAIDAEGRICVMGRDFIRAEREGTYPITVYAIGADGYVGNRPEPFEEIWD